MLKVHDYLAIRTAHAQGESKRFIARRLRHSQDTVRKAIASQTGKPEPYQRSKPADYPKLGSFLAAIDAILEEDRTAPIKQRHTAMRVYQRLVDDHQYRGKYDQVRRYINKHRRDHRETLIPLQHESGERMECDFGEVAVDFPDGRRKVDVLVAVWSWSHCPFMVAVPSQRSESVLHGMTAAFDFFGCVAREVWWDNPKTIATTILRGRERVLNPDYAALASHYRFEPRACMPARGQEKPDVESGVKALQRRACTPVPQAADLEAFNRHLLAFCLSERQRTVSEQSQTIGERFETEKASAIGLPVHRFDPCISSAVVVDKYQTVRFESNRYSVPRWAAFQPAMIKAYVDRIEVVQAERAIAGHKRSYGRDESILEPLHYLAALGRRPGALDHSGVFKGWQLPGIFAELRDRLEREHGAGAGVRQYIRVLQLLGAHPASRVGEAIRRLWHRVHLRAEDVEEKTRALSLGHDQPDAMVSAAAPVVKEDSSSARMHPEVPEYNGADAAGQITPVPMVESALLGVHVPPPDLGRFNQLLSFQCHSTDLTEPLAQGDEDHVPVDDRTAVAAAAAQPQGVEAADDAVGAREALA